MNCDMNSVDGSAEGTPTEPAAHKRILIDATQVQVVASKAELDRRIAAFIAGKRQEINRLNVIEFCHRFEEEEAAGESCARVDAVLVKKENSRGHLRTSSSINTADLQLVGTEAHCARDKGVAMSSTLLPVSDSGACYSEPLHNRLQEVEERVFRDNRPLPTELYSRKPG